MLRGGLHAPQGPAIPRAQRAALQGGHRQLAAALPRPLGHALVQRDEPLGVVREELGDERAVVRPVRVLWTSDEVVREMFLIAVGVDGDQALARLQPVVGDELAREAEQHDAVDVAGIRRHEQLRLDGGDEGGVGVAEQQVLREQRDRAQAIPRAAVVGDQLGVQAREFVEREAQQAGVGRDGAGGEGDLAVDREVRRARARRVVG